MTEEEIEKDQSNEKPKTIGDPRREAAESPRSEEEARAALKALLDLTDRIEEWRQSASDDQRKSFDQFAKELQSPIFGVNLAQLDNERDIIQAERERERLDDVLTQPIPSPEVMQLKELRELGKNLERAHKERRCWQITAITLAALDVVAAITAKVIALMR